MTSLFENTPLESSARNLCCNLPRRHTDGVASRKEQEFLGILAPTRAANCASVPATGRYCPTCPHLFRHQMLTYLTSQGLSDAQIQLISGHKTKKSLEVYQHLSLQAVERAYQEAVHSLNI